MGLVISFIKYLVSFSNYSSNSLPLVLLFAIFAFFSFLFWFSKKGYSRFSSYLLLGSVFCLALAMGLRWGADLPAEILFYVLCIVMSGILVNGRLAFIVTFLTALSFLSVNQLHARGIISVDRIWINELWGYSDIIMASLILLIIATICWLSDKEMRSALKRAYQSEKELKAERDNLEINIQEKTRELKMIQAQEMARVHRFAELGRLSSGLFHDLVNPLTTVMLNVEKIRNEQHNDHQLKEINHDIEQVDKAARKMGDFIKAVRKQIKFQGQDELFSLNQEIEEAISVLNYKAKLEKVSITFSADENLTLEGDPIKFSQIATNLISNAIDSYEGIANSNKEVEVELKRDGRDINLKIKDNGKGISAENIDRIFEPFFSTKTSKDNLGLGLSLISNLVEKDFNGKISVQSKIGKGSCFSVIIPSQKYE